MSEEEARRERTIAFDMQYCQHYTNGPGAKMICRLGVDLETLVKVPTGAKGIRWGPCIEGHTLKNPTEHCPHWIRETREQGEKRADGVERSVAILTKVMPFISQWASRKPIGKSEIVQCPACNGQLHLSQAAYNGHVAAKCETNNCVNFIQ